MQLQNHFLWQIKLVFTLSIMSLAACQAAGPLPIAASPKPSQTATLVANPTSQIDRPTETALPASPTSTLANFPDLQNEAEKPAPSILRLADISAPLALSAYDHFYFAYPLPAGSLEHSLPSGRYGTQSGAVDKGAHTGLDIAVDIGTSVLAAGSGTVLWSGIGLYNNYENDDDPYGVAVAIRHDFGYEGQRLYTVYAHMSESLVVPGQRVDLGEIIGLSGNTGFSSGPHLHFEIRVGENTIYHSRNPELWIAPPEQSGVLVARIFTTFGTRVEDHAMQITNLESGSIIWEYSYATDLNVITDSYYDENFVLSDLPAGTYEVAVPYVNGTHRMEIEIQPGAVSYFSFHGYDGFNFDLPPDPRPPHLPN